METFVANMQVIKVYVYYDSINTSRRTNAGVFLIYTYFKIFSIILEYKQNK